MSVAPKSRQRKRTFLLKSFRADETVWAFFFFFVLFFVLKKSYSWEAGARRSSVSLCVVQSATFSRLGGQCTRENIIQSARRARVDIFTYVRICVGFPLCHKRSTCIFFPSIMHPFISSSAAQENAASADECKWARGPSEKLVHFTAGLKSTAAR